MKLLLSIAASIVLAFSAVRAADSNNSFAVGSKLTLTAESTGTEPIVYKWFRDGTQIAEGSTLAFDKLELTNAGSYTVTATNAFGSATSEPYVIAVGTPPTAPVIKSAFSNVVVRKQSSVTLGVVAAGEEMKYRWQKGNSLIPGATAASLTLPKVNPSDEGMYAVTVSNPAGSVTASARLSVLR